MRRTITGQHATQLATTLIGIIVALPCAVAQSEARWPVPPLDEIAKARDAFHDLYPELSQSHRKADRVELAHHALELAMTEDMPSGDAYALLEEARGLAVSARDPGLAVQAGCAMGRRFELDTVELLIQTLKAIGSARILDAEAEIAVEHLIQLARSMREQGRIGGASALLPEIESMVKRVGRASRLREESDALVAVINRDLNYQEAVNLLVDDPSSETANTVVAEYSYSVLGDAERALKSLAAAGVNNISNLATKDLTLSQVEYGNEDHTGDQRALADAWIEIATDKKMPFRALAAERAELWYSRALDGLSGLAAIAARRGRDEAIQVMDSLGRELDPVVNARLASNVEHLVKATVVSGTWDIEEKHIVQSELNRRPQMLVFGEDLQEYSFSFDARRDAGGHAVKLVFNFQDKRNYRDFGIGTYNNAGSAATSTMDGAWQRDKQVFVKGGIEDYRWYNVRVDVQGARASCYVDGELVCEAIDENITSGRVGLATWDTRGTFRKLRLMDQDGALIATGVSAINED